LIVVVYDVDGSFDGETRFCVKVDEGRELVVVVTSEGIIMDVYDNVELDEDEGVVLDDSHSGSVGMLFGEWADWVCDERS